MGRWFRFRDAPDRFDVTAAIEGSPVLQRFRNRLVSRHGPHGQDVIEDMLVVVMRHAGDHYVTVRGRQIDKVFQLRSALEDSYHKLMRFGDDAGDTLDVHAEMDKIVKRYHELDAALADVSKPLEPLVLPPADKDMLASRFHQDLVDRPGRPLKGFPEQSSQAGGRPIERDFADRAGRVPGQKGYDARGSRAFTKGWREDPTRPGLYRHAFEDGSSGELRVENGKYALTSNQPDGATITIREEQVNLDPYGRKIRTTSLLNAHHGIQAHPMEQIFARFGYDRHAVPTIWLRNSRAGSPHGRITAASGRTGLHPTAPGSKLTPSELSSATYGDMRRIAVREMRTAGISEPGIRDYLSAHDAYFKTNVLPNIPQAKRPALLGDWSPADFTVPQ